MTSYSIGFLRDDGDFQILATLNNNDGLVSPSVIDNIAENIKETFQSKIEGEKIFIIVREDCPDYVTIE